LALDFHCGIWTPIMLGESAALDLGLCMCLELGVKCAPRDLKFVIVLYPWIQLFPFPFGMLV
jgi:hypothetical protein